MALKASHNEFRLSLYTYLCTYGHTKAIISVIYKLLNNAKKDTIYIAWQFSKIIEFTEQFGSYYRVPSVFGSFTMVFCALPFWFLLDVLSSICLFIYTIPARFVVLIFSLWNYLCLGEKLSQTPPRFWLSFRTQCCVHLSRRISLMAQHKEDITQKTKKQIKITEIAIID